MISNKLFACIFMFFLMGICYSVLQMIFLLPKLKNTDISQATFRSQTSMESMGPIRPNIITRWTKYQEKEHPEKYDLNDYVVVDYGKSRKEKEKHNMLRTNKDEIYGDSIVVDMGEKKKSAPVVSTTSAPGKPYFPRIRLDLYMESLCPDTHRFVKGALSKVAHDSSIMDIVDLHMYIFGKGSQLSVEPQKFNCQHGPAECYGNLVENCVIKYTSPGDAVDMLVCLHNVRLFDEMTIASCTKSLEDPQGVKDSIMQCIKGEGEYLLQKAYDKTPRNLGYVPSMRINKGTVVPASMNLKDVICKEWKGEKPSSCT